MRATILLAVGPALAVERSREVAAELQREHPCPSTGKQYGACPGYVRDHVNPLRNGGPDAVGNMQWQTVDNGKIKDRWERDPCRAQRRGAAGDADIGGRYATPRQGSA